ncbi:hypothetical protein DFH11DRAFT_1547236 [Phellopilus nigrolimitatus]|nr:hypothetical protein DFH11DRAFT_1547236 [Phellopilus nigrolimitatus]
MKTLADIVVKSITAGSVANIENDLLLEIQDAAQNPSSPWSKLAPPPPAVSGPRTPEHYLAALDVAIKARKDAMNCRKVANFWKRLALQVCPDSNDVALLTPSPSDISDAGPEELPPLRQARMKDLIEKRGLVLPSPTALAPTASIGVSASKANPGVSENDGRSAIKESIASKLTLRLDFDHNRSDSDSSIYFSSGSPTFLSSDSDINDETLLDTKNESASEPSTPIKERPLTIVDVCNSAVLPEKNMSLPYSPPATFPSKLKTKAASFNPLVASKRVLPSPPSSTSKNPHSPCHNSCTRPASTPTPPNRRMSNIPLTSVQTKRRMYESLVSVPNARPSPSPAPASSNNKGSSSSSHLPPTARAKYGQIASKSNTATPSVASTKKYTTPSTIHNASTGIPSSRYGTERGAPHLKSLALPHVRCVPSNIGKDNSSSPQNCRSDPSVLVQGSTRAGSVLTDVPPHVRARRIFR